MASQPIEFGHSMRAQFLFDTKWINLNHGSFGTYPIPVRNAKRGYTKLTESAPDKFLRYQCIDLLDKARERLAKVVNASTDDCVLVPNATTGINTILRNLTYKEKDVIIYFDTIYSGIEKTLMSLTETNPQVILRKVGHGQSYAYTLPMSHAEICSAFSQTISRLLYEGYNVKAAIIDTVVAMPGVRFPFERLVRMCKEYSILSIVDGGHGVGMIPLNLTELDADFFVTNCHKWLFTPRGCALMHVPQRNQSMIRTSMPTSHGYVPTGDNFIREVLPPSHKSPFVKLFEFVATTDNTAYYCVPAALNFRQNLCGGEEKIYEYIRDNAQRGADFLAMLLGTEVMDDLDPGVGLKTMGSYEGGTGQEQFSRKWIGGLRDCAMANVLLPIIVLGSSQNGSIRLGPGGAGSGGGLAPKYRQSSKRSLSLGYSRGLSPIAVSPQHSPLSISPTTEGALDPVMIRPSEIMRVCQWMESTLTTEFNTFVPIYGYDDKIWARISGQIYLELKDWEWLGDVLKGLCARVNAGEFGDTKPPWSTVRKDSEMDLEQLGRTVSEVSITVHPSPGAVFDISAGGWRKSSLA